MTVLTDATVVLVLNCCLAYGRMTHEEIMFIADGKFMMQFCDPRQDAGHYTSMPKILNDIVKDPDDHMNEIGLVCVEGPSPIQELLAGILDCDVAEYRAQLGSWIQMYESNCPLWATGW